MRTLSCRVQEEDLVARNVKDLLDLDVFLELDDALRIVSVDLLHFIQLLLFLIAGL